MATPHGDYSLSYDSAGRRLNLTHPNGMVARYDYDVADRLLEVINEHPTTGVVAKAQYTYDANGNPLTKTDTQGTTTYQYDDTDQLIGETGNGKSLQWLYDSVGNRLKETRNSQETTYTHDDANQLLSRSDGTTWTYDANGNMASETGPGGATTYTFDVENRLTRLQKGSETWQYVYGPGHERIKRVAPDGEKHYQLDGPDVLAEYDPSGGLLARNVHTLSVDEILSRGMGGQTFHYAVDGLRSVQALTAVDGSVAANYQYEGFGNVTETGGTANPYKFTGREDEGNGLYYYRERFYSPSKGVFITADPIRFASGDLNLYRYVFNSPTVWNDPTGQVVPVAVAVGAAIGAVAGGASAAASGQNAANVAKAALVGAAAGALSGTGIGGVVGSAAISGAASVATQGWTNPGGQINGNAVGASMAAGALGAAVGNAASKVFWLPPGSPIGRPIPDPGGGVGASNATIGSGAGGVAGGALDGLFNWLLPQSPPGPCK